MRHRSRLKSWGLDAILAPMAIARLPAVLLVVLAAVLTAQNTSTGQVVITVIDQDGGLFRVRILGLSSCQVLPRMMVTGSITRFMCQSSHRPTPMLTAKQPSDSRKGVTPFSLLKTDSSAVSKE
jgi:hypothetical protein